MPERRQRRLVERNCSVLVPAAAAALQSALPREKKHGFRGVSAAFAAHEQIGSVTRHAHKAHLKTRLDEKLAPLVLRQKVNRVQKQPLELLGGLLPRADVSRKLAEILSKAHFLHV